MPLPVFDSFKFSFAFIRSLENPCSNISFRDPSEPIPPELVGFLGRLLFPCFAEVSLQKSFQAEPEFVFVAEELHCRGILDFLATISVFSLHSGCNCLVLGHRKKSKTRH